MEATKQEKAALKHKEMGLRGKAHQKTVTDKGKNSILGQSEYMAHGQNTERRCPLNNSENTITSLIVHESWQ